jgi:hypothetical protein
MKVLDGKMTVKDALEFCSPAQRSHLSHWADKFGVTLREFHIGHIRTYESDRLREVDLHVVNAEVDSLLRLVESAGGGDLSLRKYRPLQESYVLTLEERKELPTRAQKFIEVLEREIERLTTENDRLMNMLRKTVARRKRS